MHQQIDVKTMFSCQWIEKKIFMYVVGENDIGETNYKMIILGENKTVYVVISQYYTILLASNYCYSNIHCSFSHLNALSLLFAIAYRAFKGKAITIYQRQFIKEKKKKTCIQKF